MNNEQFLKNLKTPENKVDVVLDTDTYNEIDDQFAIAYMLKNADKLNCKGICAAPFYNMNSASPEDGMEKSYDEIHKILNLMGEKRRFIKVQGIILKTKTHHRNRKVLILWRNLQMNILPKVHYI